ncbi:MAG TPA: hypothetical protein VMF89_05610, partial [Polyangiales bacterium]|nr:hypothetical protein [Polyangiales bacterium]
MNIDLQLIKYASLLVLLAASLLFAFWSAHRSELPGSSTFERYVQYLDGRLRRLFQPTHGRLIAVMQLCFALLTLAVMLATREPLTLALLPFIALGPHVYLQRAEAQKLQKIE